MKAEEIYNGTNGTLWLNDNVELASVQSFTLRQKNNFEETARTRWQTWRQSRTGKARSAPPL